MIDWMNPSPDIIEARNIGYRYGIEVCEKSNRQEIEELEEKVEKLQIPLCIGVETIKTLVETGKAEFSDHAPLIAADSLCQNFDATKEDKMILGSWIRYAKALRNAWNDIKACCGEGGSKGRPMDLFNQSDWKRMENWQREINDARPKTEV